MPTNSSKMYRFISLNFTGKHTLLKRYLSKKITQSTTSSLKNFLLNSYQQLPLVKEALSPKMIDRHALSKSIQHWMAYANKPYASRNNDGIYYLEDYVEQHGFQHKTINEIHAAHWQGNPSYFLPAVHKFTAKPSVKPSEALNAYFHGPTIADCGSVLQACYYKATEEVIGTKIFNQAFTSPIKPFEITLLLTEPQSKDSALGSPIYFLFNETPSRKIIESQIKPGDFAYIQGVWRYTAKDPFGPAQGWNLVCTGENEFGEKLFYGFNPEKFLKPLAYQEIKKLLIDSYNLPTTPHEIEFLHSQTNQFKAFALEAQLGLKLIDDKLDYSDEIECYTFHKAFNLRKLIQLKRQLATSIPKRFNQKFFDKEISIAKEKIAMTHLRPK